MTTCTYVYIHTVTYTCMQSSVFTSAQALHSVPIFSSNCITSSVKVVFALLSGHNTKFDLLGWWI